MTPTSVATVILLLAILNSVDSEFFDSEDVKIVLYYGPSRSDSVSYPLAEAEKVLDDPHFNRFSTVLNVLDYHEPQVKELRTHILVDAYSELQICNFLVLDWGAPVVPKEDVKDPDLETLVPMVTSFLMKVHERTDWKEFSVLAYARGTEFIANVVVDLFQKTNIRITRISQLDPPKSYKINGKQVDNQKDIITNFVDAIHTDIGNHGTNFSRAHVDFFPNGGSAPQPGCPDGGACSRRRAILYWVESLHSPLAFCSFKADSYEEYKEKGGNNTQSEEVPMGVACFSWTRGKYFLDTNAESPYGKGCLEEQWTTNDDNSQK